MAHLVASSDFPQLKQLFEPLCVHMAVGSALAGRSSAQIYADSTERPQSGIIWMRYRLFLVGDPINQATLSDLRSLFLEEIIPQQLQAGRGGFLLYYAPHHWEQRIGDLLPGVSSTRYWRHYYRYKHQSLDWRSRLPEGFSLRQVDADLLETQGLKNLPELEEEMCSERSSVAEFLEKSFGLCLVHQDEQAGWCLSEYNQDGGCEIGIGVQEAHRRHGLATLMTAAFIEEAQQRGIHKIGWDCWKENRPSVATALKAGFELVEEYPVYSCNLTKEES